MKLEKKVYELLEVGTYAAMVQTIEQVTGQYGDQAKFTFALDDSDVTLTAWASAKYGNKTKLGRWAAAILGGMPDTLDTDDLVGKPCRITVVVKAKDDGTQYNKVDEVLPPKKGQKPKPEEAVIPTVEEAPLPF
jgi:hypothetical protein